ncbi:MAG: ScyD/ScyE family protein, partial [Anaerolineales bacterium]|nr:ScyD/ScyE family protein [Anaerolineales bacterium]
MKRSPLALLLLTLLALAACQTGLPESQSTATGPTASVVLDDLLNPVGLTVLEDGTLLVAEEGSGERDLSAGVTALLPDGRSGRFLADFPSSRDSGDLSGVPFVAYADGTLYTSHFRLGHLLTLELSLPLSLPDTPYTPDDMAPRMTPLNNVALVNPFGLTFSAIGLPVVSDATENGVAMMTNGGQTRFFHRFDPLPNPGEGKQTIDAVPTGIARNGDEYLVTLTGGCPFPAGGGRLVAIDDNRSERLITDGLNMPIGVQLDANETIWLLEFATFDSDAG